MKSLGLALCVGSLSFSSVSQEMNTQDQYVDEFCAIHQSLASSLGGMSQDIREAFQDLPNSQKALSAVQKRATKLLREFSERIQQLEDSYYGKFSGEGNTIDLSRPETLTREQVARAQRLLPCLKESIENSLVIFLFVSNSSLISLRADLDHEEGPQAKEQREWEYQTQLEMIKTEAGEIQQRLRMLDSVQLKLEQREQELETLQESK